MVIDSTFCWFETSVQASVEDRAVRGYPKSYQVILGYLDNFKVNFKVIHFIEESRRYRSLQLLCHNVNFRLYLGMKTARKNNAIHVGISTVSLSVALEVDFDW